MCGIAGLLLPSDQVPSQDIVDSFKDSLQHRGPDDSGHLLFESAALVHTRLSIIDVAGGHQPFQSPSGVSLIMNGEIYNYVELRETYASYPFTSQSDAEVILPLYHEKGEKALTQDLRGMYGLCLYDPDQKKAILSRDPFGIKPLYYVILPQGGVGFASEASALFKAGLTKAMVNPKARSEALQLGFTIGAKTVTGFVQRLLPGETLVIEDGRITDQYRAFLPGALSASSQRAPKSSKPEASKPPLPLVLKELEETLRDSVRVHLRSDVPYGLFLSGGLDSATLLKLMTEEAGRPIRTYTIGFSGAMVHDERAQAQHLARHFNSEHTEMDFGEKDFWQLLPFVAQSCDDLHFDQAMLPTFKLAKEASKELKVVLSGEGGDEFFAGYRRYQKALRPWFLGSYTPRKKGFFDRLKKLTFPYLGGWREDFSTLEKGTAHKGMSKLRRQLVLDQESWLPNDLLLKLDRCLMAHGLEGRTPFLDLKVRGFTESLPDAYLVRQQYGKWVLRQWLKASLPESQPFAKKKGFRVPVGEWISAKGPRLASLVARQEGIEEIVSYDQVKKIFMGQDDRTLFAAWQLLFYAVWHQVHILQKKPIPDTLAMLSRA